MAAGLDLFSQKAKQLTNESKQSALFWSATNLYKEPKL